MALSKAASKLLAFLNMYKITPTKYYERINGSVAGNESKYNTNWFIGQMDDRGSKGRKAASQRKGTFKTALAELISQGY